MCGVCQYVHREVRSFLKVHTHRREDSTQTTYAGEGVELKEQKATEVLVEGNMGEEGKITLYIVRVGKCPRAVKSHHRVGSINGRRLLAIYCMYCIYI